MRVCRPESARLLPYEHDLMMIIHVCWDVMGCNIGHLRIGIRLKAECLSVFRPRELTAVL